jgi:hypothetical protein
VICDRSVVFSGVLHQYNWPPRYNWNIVESGIKHQATNKPTLLLYVTSSTVKPFYSGHLGKIDKMTTIYRRPLYEGFWFFDKILHTSSVVNKHFSLHLMFIIMFYLLFCYCRNITLVYIYCWWNYLNMIWFE